MSPSSGADRIPRDRGGRDTPTKARLLSIAWADDTPRPESEEEEPVPAEEQITDLRRLLGDATRGGDEPSTKRRHKPRLVYFFRGSLETAERDKVEAALFEHEPIVLASHFFSCRRVDVEKLPSEDERATRFAKTPAFAFEDLNGEVAVTGTGVGTHRALQRKMEEFWKHQYGSRFRTHLRQYTKVLDEIEHTQERLMHLRTLSGALRMEKEDSKSKSLERRLKAAKDQEATLQARLPELRKEKDALLDPPLARDWTWKAPGK